MMNTFKLLLIGSLVSTLAACASSPKANSFSERLMDKSERSQSIAKQWDKGNGMVAKGEKMKVKGQKNINDGKEQITEGERMIQDGTSLIENGQKMMADSESSYQTMRANPIPLPSAAP